MSSSRVPKQSESVAQRPEELSDKAHTKPSRKETNRTSRHLVFTAAPNPYRGIIVRQRGTDAWNGSCRSGSQTNEGPCKTRSWTTASTGWMHNTKRCPSKNHQGMCKSTSGYNSSLTIPQTFDPPCKTFASKRPQTPRRNCS